MLTCKQNQGSDTPLRKAIYHGHVVCVRLLLERGASLTASESTISPLHLGAFKGHAACLELLLGRGLEIDKRDENSMVTMHAWRG